jgi:hypothetical protein
MRRCFAVLAATCAVAGALMAPALAGARHFHFHFHHHGLTISATPNPIPAGQGVFIYGQLRGPNSANQTITLYHRILPSPFFSPISTTTTNSFGFYDFIRPDGIVMSNRDWYVRGPNGTRSRTVREYVSALVNASASTTTATTGQVVLFTGQVTPNHPYQRVLLQEQSSLNGNGWTTIASAFTGAGSTFTIPHRWARAGDHTVRVVFPGDPRNLAGISDPMTVVVQQRQQADFTINSSDPIIVYGGQVTINGALDKPGTTTPEPSTEVTLWAHQDDSKWQALATTITAADGSYSFTRSPSNGTGISNNTAFQVRTTLSPMRHTTVLYEGVQDVVTLSASSLTGAVGTSVTLSGTVSPAHGGHWIYLERLGADQRWHPVAGTVVTPGSTFSFTYTLSQLGTVQLRARITGGPENVGAASPQVTITVNGVAPVTTLPVSS